MLKPLFARFFKFLALLIQILKNVGFVFTENGFIFLAQQIVAAVGIEFVQQVRYCKFVWLLVATAIRVSVGLILHSKSIV